MDLRQNPLLGDDDIPSPLFTPQPGWGGQMGAWMRENTYLLVFRGVLAVSIALIVISLLRVRPVAELALTPTPSAALTANAITAVRGDTLSSLAGRALGAYLTAHPEHTGLTPAHKLFITDVLWRAAEAVQSKRPFVLEVGMSVTFPDASLEASISEAKRLTPSQLAAWERLLR